MDVGVLVYVRSTEKQGKVSQLEFGFCCFEYNRFVDKGLHAMLLG
jgi:hypothetical protein